jgi:hypothetical protein
VETGIVGFHAGLQQQFGNWVIGVEAAINHQPNRNNQSNFAPCVDPAFTCGLGFLQNVSTIGAKLGYAWDRVLISVQGGWATGVFYRNDFLLATGVYCLGIASTACTVARHNGWYAGATLEYMIGSTRFVDFIAGFDYQHIRLDSRADVEFAGPDVFLHNQDADVDIVRARLTIKFNTWRAWAAPLAARF